MTNKDFIEKARSVHGDKYDYSKVEYKNNKTNIIIICPIHGEYKQVPQNHYRGAGCPICSREKKHRKMSKTNEMFIQESKNIFGENKFNYSNVEYINNKTPIQLQCNECGHMFKVRPDNHLKLCSSCPQCAKPISRWENEIFDFLKHENVEVIQSERTLLEGKEIDLYLPQYNIGIKCDGLYYHSNIFKTDDYHLSKTKEAFSKNINLVHIFEDEWYTQQEKVKSILLHKLGKTQRKIGAKLCIVKNINDKNRDIFLKENNIENELKHSTINFGLYLYDELLYIICGTICDDVFKIERCCSKLYFLIQGGFSKLLKHIQNEMKINIFQIESDKRYFFNLSLIKNNFKEIFVMPPQQYGIKQKQRIDIDNKKYYICDCGRTLFETFNVN